MVNRTVACVVGLIVTLCYSNASIVTADKPLFTEARDRIFQYAGEQGLPSGIPKLKQPFIFFSLGPTRLDFFCVGHPRDDQQKLGNAIDKAIKSAYGKELVITSASERGLWIFDTDDTTAGWLKTSAKSQLKMSAFRDEMRGSGYSPNILLRTPLHAVESGVGSRQNSKRRWAYYNASDLTTIKVSERVTLVDQLLLILFVLWPFLAIHGGIRKAIKQAIDETKTLEDRKQSYTNTIYGSLGLAIGLHLPIVVYLFGAGCLDVFSDLWFGTSQGLSFLSLGMLFLTFLLGFVSRKTQTIEAQLFGTSVEAMKAADRQTAALKRPGYIVAMTISLIGFALGCYVIAALNQPQFGISILLLAALGGVSSMTVFDKLAERRSRANSEVSKGQV